MPIKKVISGGQVGADIAGLRAARAFGIQTGGHAPKGFRILSGVNPELGTIYGLEQLEEDGYIYRTEANVKNSDGTIRFAFNFDSPGERATKRYITKHKKPYFDVAIGIDPTTGKCTEMIPGPQLAAAWIETKSIEVLNVAGNSFTRFEKDVERYLTEVFKIVNWRE